jgi:S-adenosylmethionine synthetase
MGVDVGGAGDQGLMFGFACRETDELMPMPITLAHRLTRRLAEARKSGEVEWLRPDGKSQVTVEYQGFQPLRVRTVVVSTQHSDRVEREELRRTIVERVIRPVIPAGLLADDTVFHINPTGRFVVGGPQGDCGLTGRKIIVDTYGGVGSHGGGAFSGKDPTKVDRSASYMARHVAKNLVASGIVDRLEVQLAYAIGVAEPVSIHVEAFGTSRVPTERLEGLIRDHFPLSPTGIIEYLDLRRPIYRQTAAYGHFGREGVPWEATHRAAELRLAAGVTAVAS